MLISFLYKCLFSTLFLSFIICDSFAQTYKLSDFKKIPLPFSGSSKRKKLNFLDDGFSVKKVGDSIEISKYSRPDYSMGLSLPVVGGNIVYGSNGSWTNPGSELFYAPQYRNRITIETMINSSIRFLYKYKESVFFVETSQVGSYGCSISRININNDTFSISNIIYLDDYPKAMEIFKDSIFIIGQHSFAEFKQQMQRYVNLAI